jgi:hypothetical protein
MYETRHQSPLPGLGFVRRLLNHLGLALALLALSLCAGMAGYMYFEDLSCTDAFLNATMLLGGMGPVNTPRTEAGKLFAGLYALYAGLVFIATTALMFTPVIHRVIHHFHWNQKP